jgi:hypothetical protein
LPPPSLLVGCRRAAVRVPSGLRASCPCRPCTAAGRLGVVHARQSASSSARPRLDDPSSTLDVTGRGRVLFPVFPCPPDRWGRGRQAGREGPPSANLPRQRFRHLGSSPRDFNSFRIAPRAPNRRFPFRRALKAKLDRASWLPSPLPRTPKLVVSLASPRHPLHRAHHPGGPFVAQLSWAWSRHRGAPRVARAHVATPAPTVPNLTIALGSFVVSL